MASKTKCCIAGGIFLFLLGAAIFALGWSIKTIVSNAINDGVKTTLKIQQSKASADPTSSWQTDTIHFNVSYDIWVYNITNYANLTDETLSTLVTPKYDIVGPFRYQEVNELYNWTFSADGSLFIYNNWLRYEADEENFNSYGRDYAKFNPYVYVLNVPYLVVLSSLNQVGIAAATNPQLAAFSNILYPNDGWASEANLLALQFTNLVFPSVGSSFLNQSDTMSVAYLLKGYSVPMYLVASLAEGAQAQATHPDCIAFFGGDATPDAQFFSQWAFSDLGTSQPEFASRCGLPQFSLFELPHPELTFNATLAPALFNSLYNNFGIYKNWLTVVTSGCASNPTSPVCADALSTLSTFYTSQGFSTDDWSVLTQRVPLYIGTLLQANTTLFDTPALHGWTYAFSNLKSTAEGANPAFSTIPNWSTFWGYATNTALLTSFSDLAALQMGTGLVGAVATSQFKPMSVSALYPPLAQAYMLPAEFAGPEFAWFAFNSEYSLDNATSHCDVCFGVNSALQRYCHWINLAMPAAQVQALFQNFRYDPSSSNNFTTFMITSLVSKSNAVLSAQALGFTSDRIWMLRTWMFNKIPYYMFFRPQILHAFGNEKIFTNFKPTCSECANGTATDWYVNNKEFTGGLFVRRTVKQVATGYFDPIAWSAQGVTYPGPLPGNYTSADDHYAKTHQGRYELYTGTTDVNLARHFRAYKNVTAFQTVADLLGTGEGYSKSDCSSIMAGGINASVAGVFTVTGKCNVWTDREYIDTTTEGRYTFPFQNDAVIPELDNFFISQAMRRINLTYETDVMVKGIHLRRYRLKESSFYNVTGELNNPNNAPYYMDYLWQVNTTLPIPDAYPTVTRKSVFYSPLGLVSVSTNNKGAPLYVHKSAFTLSPDRPVDRDVLDGLQVTYNGAPFNLSEYHAEFDSFIDIEPLSGAAMNVNKSLQLTAWLPLSWIVPKTQELFILRAGVPNMPALPYTRNLFKADGTAVEKLIMPVGMFNQFGAIKDKDASDFRSAIYDNRDLANNLKIVGIIVGFFIMVGGLLCTAYWVRKGKQGDGETGVTRLDSASSLNTTA